MEHVLIVDNDRDHLAVIAEFAGRHFATLTAESAEEAIEIVGTTQRIVGVITDFHMRILTGADLLQHVRDTLPEAKRVLMSAGLQDDPKLRQQVIERCAPDLFLPKPINPALLRRTLSSWKVQE